MPAILDDGHENYANVNEVDETDLLVLVKHLISVVEIKMMSRSRVRKLLSKEFF